MNNATGRARAGIATDRQMSESHLADSGRILPTYSELEKSRKSRLHEHNLKDGADSTIFVKKFVAFEILCLRLHNMHKAYCRLFPKNHDAIIDGIQKVYGKHFFTLVKYAMEASMVIDAFKFFDKGNRNAAFQEMCDMCTGDIDCNSLLSDLESTKGVIDRTRHSRVAHIGEIQLRRNMDDMGDLLDIESNFKSFHDEIHEIIHCSQSILKKVDLHMFSQDDVYRLNATRGNDVYHFVAALLENDRFRISCDMGGHFNPNSDVIKEEQKKRLLNQSEINVVKS